MQSKMLLTFRTIGNKVYKAEFDLSQTVASVKATLASTYNYELSKMRLIFKAHVLPDSRTLQEVGIDGNGFIVLHAASASSPTRPKVTANTENSPAAIEPPESPQIESSAPPPPPTEPSTEPFPSLPRYGGPTPPGFDAKIDNLEALGFSRGDCEVALRASHGNVDRAADFLLSGHVPDLPQMISTSESPGADSDSEDDDDDHEGDDDDEATRIRRFARFRDALIRNPASLRSFLHQAAEDNPAVAILIRDDPAAFLASIGLNPNDFNLQGLGRTTQYEELMSGFSDLEKEAIHRLEQLGVDTMTIIQVFVACDKDEALTRECLRSMQ
jgi:UV excision repair protein RAD23